MRDNKIAVIVGGNFANKGAELMVSVAINIVKSSGNNITPIVVNSFPGFKRIYEYDGVKVLNVPFYLNFAYCIIKGVGFSPKLVMRTMRMFLSGIKRGTLFKDIKAGISTLSSIKKASYVVDISGYGYNSNSELMNYIQLSFSKFASIKSVPYVYFPQSFGLFDNKNKTMGIQIKGAINTAAYVFCRENLSMKEVDSLTNSYSGGYWPDIALLYGRQAAENEIPENIDMHLVKNSVVLIPNARLYDKYSENKTNNLYNMLISNMLDLGCKVTILKHSSDDIGAVENIRQKFLNKVYVLDKDYDLNVVGSIIASSQFVVSGRYHGLVVSLKNAIPCIAIGWSHKYDELLGIYGLENFNFDLSKKTDDGEIYSQLLNIINTRSSVAQNIKETNDRLLSTYPLSKFISLYYHE